MHPLLYNPQVVDILFTNFSFKRIPTIAYLLQVSWYFRIAGILLLKRNKFAMH